MTPTETAHIVLDERGVAWIDGANTKVIEVVLDKLVHGWSPEEIHLQHRRLPLAKIHAALSYYYDHKEELDAEMERRYQEVQELRAQSTPVVKREALEARLKQQEEARKSA